MEYDHKDCYSWPMHNANLVNLVYLVKFANKILANVD